MMSNEAAGRVPNLLNSHLTAVAIFIQLQDRSRIYSVTRQEYFHPELLPICKSGPEVIKLSSCSTQLSMKF